MPDNELVDEIDDAEKDDVLAKRETGIGEELAKKLTAIDIPKPYKKSAKKDAKKRGRGFTKPVIVSKNPRKVAKARKARKRQTIPKRIFKKPDGPA